MFSWLLMRLNAVSLFRDASADGAKFDSPEIDCLGVELTLKRPFRIDPSGGGGVIELVIPRPSSNALDSSWLANSGGVDKIGLLVLGGVPKGSNNSRGVIVS